MKRSKAGTQWFLTYRDLGPPSLRKGQGRDKSREKERKRKPRPDWDETIHDLSQYKLTEEEIEEKRKAAASKNAVHISRSDVENWVPQFGYDERGRFHSFIAQPRFVSEDSFQGGRRHQKPQPWRPGGTPNFLEHLANSRSLLRRPMTPHHVDDNENESLDLEKQAQGSQNLGEKDGRFGKGAEGNLGPGENAPGDFGVNGVVDFDEEVLRFEAKQRLIESLQKRKKPEASSGGPSSRLEENGWGGCFQGEAVEGSEPLEVRRSEGTRRRGRIDEGRLAGLEKGFADLEAKVSQAVEANSKAGGASKGGRIERHKRGGSVSWQGGENEPESGGRDRNSAQERREREGFEEGESAVGNDEFSVRVSANGAEEGRGLGGSNRGVALSAFDDVAAPGNERRERESGGGFSEQHSETEANGARDGHAAAAQSDGSRRPDRPASAGGRSNVAQLSGAVSPSDLQERSEAKQSAQGTMVEGSRLRDESYERKAATARMEEQISAGEGRGDLTVEGVPRGEQTVVHEPRDSSNEERQPDSRNLDLGSKPSAANVGGGSDDPGERTGREQPGKVPGRRPAVVERTAPGGRGMEAPTSVSAVDAMAHLDRLSQGLQTCLAENQSLKSDFAEFKAHASTILTGLQLHVQKLLDLMPSSSGHVAPSPSLPAPKSFESGSTVRDQNRPESTVPTGTFELKLPILDEDLVDSIPLPSYAELRATSPQKRPIVQRHVRRADAVRTSTGLEPMPRALPATLRTSLRPSHASR